MASPFADLLKLLEKQKADLLSEIECWPPEKLSCRPYSSDWSVLEMVDHIVKTEIAILAAARLGLAKPHRIRVGDRLRTTFLEKIFASDRKVKVPTSAREVLPGSALELEEIRRRWNSSREELSSFVNQDNYARLSQGIFKHPVGGWMGMKQILNFFSVHLIHHRYQLARIVHSIALEET